MVGFHCEKFSFSSFTCLFLHPATLFEFVFFLELDASVQDPSVLAMLEEMERSCAEFQFLGNYAEV